MSLSFTTAYCNIEFYARELCRRVLRRRVVILSFIPASYVVEFYDCVPGCRVSWTRAKIDESTGHVLKCRGSFNYYNHNIHASDNAFFNHYHLLAYKKK